MTDETPSTVETVAEAAAPVETPENVDSAPTNETPENVEQDTPETPKREHWAQKRIDELTRNWREEQRRTEQLLAMVQQQKTVEPQKAPEPAKLPTLEEFGYDEAKYQAALIEYADRRASETVEKRFSEYERQRAEQARMESFATRQREFAKATPDFEDKVLRDPTLPITEAMRDVIVDSDAGPELAYYLANNRELAQQIAALPPHLAALEMGRIEGRLAAQKEAKAAVAKSPKPPVTQAPPPPPKVEEVESPLPQVKASDPESDKLSQQEWFRLREKELKRKKA